MKQASVFLQLVIFSLVFGLGSSLPTSLASANDCLERAFAKPQLAVATVKKPRLIILSAPSGGGKTTLALMLIKHIPKLALSISSTTRAPRGQEKNGVDYHFLSKEEFQAKIARGEFAEWAEVHGNYYGTDATNITAQHVQGRSVIALLDIKGAENIKKRFPEEVFTVFVSPPSLEVLEQRLRSRGTDSEQAIQLRLANAREEMKAASKYDAVIVNDDLQIAYQDLAKVIKEIIP